MPLLDSIAGNVRMRFCYKQALEEEKTKREMMSIKAIHAVPTLPGFRAVNNQMKRP